MPFGPFVLERRIAVGGSAEVFLARPKLGSRPAPRLVVKRLLPGLGGDGFSDLEREAALNRAVRHPNVVEVYGAGMVGPEPYLALEYIDGVDLFRLIRRAEAEQRSVPVPLATYVAIAMAHALHAVHRAKDDAGQPLHVVHRDVTPSNVYLSVAGDVKLGDFGIARISEGSQHGASSSQGLKGKFGYLAPEQVAGEPFDHRADLFALAVVYGELLIGERVFPGAGQLAVLLAIRDVDVTPLRDRYPSFPPGLPEIFDRLLARDPAERYANGAEIAEALAPFASPDVAASRRELAEWVAWARDASQFAQRIEGQVRDSVERMRAVRQSSGAVQAVRASQGTGLVNVRRRDGTRIDAIPFPRLVEMIATGDVGGEDEVSLSGEDFTRIADVSELARHLLPSTTAVTGRLFEPGVPDYHAELDQISMLGVLARLRTKRETGALFLEQRTAEGLRRKELYVRHGRLHHVVSSERDERLGEYLVRRGGVDREAVQVALRIVAKSGGRLGDTLVSLGLVDAMTLFRAIRDQGRDRVATLCTWTNGRALFYRGTNALRVEFPLDLDLASPMMAGVLYQAGAKVRDRLPGDEQLVLPGPRAYLATDRKELGTAPASLRRLPELVGEAIAVGALIQALRAPTPDGRRISEAEACAAIAVAVELGWAQVD